MAWPVTQVCSPNDEEPDDPEPGGKGVEEKGNVQLGDVLDGDAAKQDQGDRKSNVEEDQQNIEDVLQLSRLPSAIVVRHFLQYFTSILF